jgi:menaquinol-cytochrome c reductase iron-sulfur subunit
VAQRRNFLKTAINTFWGGITGAILIPASRYLVSAGDRRQEQNWIQIGDVGRFPKEVPQQVSFERTRTDAWREITEKTTAWILKSSDGNIAAFSPTCPHLGCAYRWEDLKKQFVCPCHASAFSSNGEVLSGPAPRPLDRYEARIADNVLFINPAARS